MFIYNKFNFFVGAVLIFVVLQLSIFIEFFEVAVSFYSLFMFVNYVYGFIAILTIFDKKCKIANALWSISYLFIVTIDIIYAIKIFYYVGNFDVRINFFNELIFIEMVLYPYIFTQTYNIYNKYKCNNKKITVHILMEFILAVIGCALTVYLITFYILI